MRAEIEMTDDEWEALRSATHVEDANQALRQALVDYLRRVAIDELIELPGKIYIQDNWRASEQAELDELERSKETRK